MKLMDKMYLLNFEEESLPKDESERISNNGLTTQDIRRRMERIINSGDGTYEFDIRIDTDDIICIKYLLSLMK